MKTEDGDIYSYNKKIKNNLNEDLIGECLTILERLDNIKEDVVNWEERAQMAEVSQRHSQFFEADNNEKKDMNDSNTSLEKLFNKIGGNPFSDND